MKNPFPFERINIGDCFYGRSESLAYLNETVSYGNNLLIYSKRRTGKSALTVHFGDLFQKKYLFIYVDLFDIVSKEDFAKHLLSALTNSTKLDIKQAMKKFGSLFKRARTEATVDPQSGELTIRPVVASLSFDEMLDDFFSSIKTLSKDKNVVVVLDEFQQIVEVKDVKLDATLRKYIQDRGDKISYIFLGSKRHMLTSLFQHKAPLFDMATHYELPPLSFQSIKDYVSKYLTISDEMIEYIQDVCANETKMMQNIFYLLYVKEVKSITREEVDAVLDIIIDSKDSSYKIIFDSLSSSQKIALKVISRYPSGFYIKEVFDEYGISKQSLQSAVNTLFKKELIDKDSEKYFIPDRSFELWSKKHKW